MRTSLLEFLSMTTSTLLASWFVGINRACVVCCANLRARTSLSPMILLRKLLFAPTETSAVSEEKRASRRGSIESLTIAFEKTRDAAKSLSVSMKSDGKPSRTLKLFIQV